MGEALVDNLAALSMAGCRLPAGVLDLDREEGDEELEEDEDAKSPCGA